MKATHRNKAVSKTWRRQKGSSATKSTHYPNAAQVECGVRLALTENNCQEMHEKIKLCEVNVPQKIGKGKKVRLRREWFHPVAWTLDQLKWTKRHNHTDTLKERRDTTCSYLELACLIDVLTGGAVGPVGADYMTKVAIIKACVRQLLKGAKVVKEGATVPVANFILEETSVIAVAPMGFSSLPGIFRRPCMSDYPGLHTAVGTLLCHAANSPDKLAARMPRYVWFKAQWRHDTLEEMWAHVVARRKQGPPRRDKLVPDLVPHKPKMVPEAVQQQ